MDSSPTFIVPLADVAHFTPSPVGPVEIPEWERERLASMTFAELYEEGLVRRPNHPFAYAEYNRRAVLPVSRRGL